jgi:hypothetical protein
MVMEDHTPVYKGRKEITKLGQAVLSHPPYSQDLDLSDFHLLVQTKNAIHGQKCGDYDTITKEVKM